MLKPYEEKLKLIKSEVEKLGLDVVEALEVCLKSLNERKIENLKNVEISEKKFLAKSNELCYNQLVRIETRSESRKTCSHIYL